MTMGKAIIKLKYTENILILPIINIKRITDNN